jgi:protein-S-isoprenylcysteine O-methyltransferase Ste14
MRSRISLWLKALLFTFVAPGSVLGLVPGLLLSDGRGRVPVSLGVLEVMALALAAAGTALYSVCLATFLHVGQGTPAPVDPPKSMVAVGPYRYVRNPMYVAVAAIVAAEGLLFRSAAMAAYGGILCAAFHAFVVLYEEPNLHSRFGESYDRYRSQVPRYLPRRVRE